VAVFRLFFSAGGGNSPSHTQMAEMAEQFFCPWKRLDGAYRFIKVRIMLFLELLDVDFGRT
jgi:hypothetical protein